MMTNIKFSVTKFGKPLDSKLYIWDIRTKTFTTKEEHLILDFSGIDNVTFETGNHCTFITSSYCVFKTGSYCNFKTGDYCNFFTRLYCIFEVGVDCSLNSIEREIFENDLTLKPNKKFLITICGEVKELLGYILTTIHSISWWKENKEIVIQVDDENATLNYWKTYYKSIARDNGFGKNFISEFPNHLKTIEESLSKKSKPKSKRERNTLGQFCKKDPLTKYKMLTILLEHF